MSASPENESKEQQWAGALRAFLQHGLAYTQGYEEVRRLIGDHHHALLRDLDAFYEEFAWDALPKPDPPPADVEEIAKQTLLLEIDHLTRVRDFIRAMKTHLHLFKASPRDKRCGHHDEYSDSRVHVNTRSPGVRMCPMYRTLNDELEGAVLDYPVVLHRCVSLPLFFLRMREMVSSARDIPEVKRVAVGWAKRYYRSLWDAALDLPSRPRHFEWDARALRQVESKITALIRGLETELKNRKRAGDVQPAGASKRVKRCVST